MDTQEVAINYEDRARELIGNSHCQGCPVLEEKYIIPAVIIDYSLEWRKTAGALNLTRLALFSVIKPDSIPEGQTETFSDLRGKFTRIFGFEPKEVAEKFDPLTTDSLGTVAVILLNGIPQASKKRGNSLIGALEGRLSSCPNLIDNPEICPVKP